MNKQMSERDEELAGLRKELQEMKACRDVARRD